MRRARGAAVDRDARRVGVRALRCGRPGHPLGVPDHVHRRARVRTRSQLLLADHDGPIDAATGSGSRAGLARPDVLGRRGHDGDRRRHRHPAAPVVAGRGLQHRAARRDLRRVVVEVLAREELVPGIAAPDPRLVRLGDRRHLQRAGLGARGRLADRGAAGRRGSARRASLGCRCRARTVGAPDRAPDRRGRVPVDRGVRPGCDRFVGRPLESVPPHPRRARSCRRSRSRSTRCSIAHASWASSQSPCCWSGSPATSRTRTTTRGISGSSTTRRAGSSCRSAAIRSRRPCPRQCARNRTGRRRSRSAGCSSGIASGRVPQHPAREPDRSANQSVAALAHGARRAQRISLRGAARRATTLRLRPGEKIGVNGRIAVVLVTPRGNSGEAAVRQRIAQPVVHAHARRGRRSVAAARRARRRVRRRAVQGSAGLIRGQHSAAERDRGLMCNVSGPPTARRV